MVTLSGEFEICKSALMMTNFQFIFLLFPLIIDAFEAFDVKKNTRCDPAQDPSKSQPNSGNLDPTPHPFPSHPSHNFLTFPTNYVFRSKKARKTIAMQLASKILLLLLFSLAHIKCIPKRGRNSA